MLRGGSSRIVFAFVAMLLALMAGASAPAFAQISQSDAPGRERERFTEPVAPRAQPGGVAIALPSSVAPPAADTTTLKLLRVVVLGSTVYRQEQFVPIYSDLVGKVITLQAAYDIAARITAKYGADG